MNKYFITSVVSHYARIVYNFLTFPFDYLFNEPFRTQYKGRKWARKWVKERGYM